MLGKQFIRLNKDENAGYCALGMCHLQVFYQYVATGILGVTTKDKIPMLKKARSILILLLLSPGVFAQQLTFCEDPASDFDGDGFGFENGQSCVAFLPDLTPPAVSVGIVRLCLTDSDPDGDGYGWEDNQSCVTLERMIDDTGETAEIARDSSGFPVCSAGLVDEDGDGFGYENRRSCKFGTEVASTTIGSQTPGQFIGDQVPVDPNTENDVIADGVLSDDTDDTALSDADGLDDESVDSSASSLDTETQDVDAISDLAPGEFGIQDLEARVCDVGAMASSGSLVLDNAIFEQGDDFFGLSTQCMEVVNGNIQWRFNYPTFGVEIAGYPSATLVNNTNDPLPTISYSYNSVLSGSDAYIVLEAAFSEQCSGNTSYQVDYYLSGSPDLGASQGTANIDGRSWQVFSLKGNANGISLVAPSSNTAGVFDLSVLANTLQSGSIPGAPALGNDACLSSAKIGTPIYSGFGTFTLQQFESTNDTGDRQPLLVTNEGESQISTPLVGATTTDVNESQAAVSVVSAINGGQQDTQVQDREEFITFVENNDSSVTGIELIDPPAVATPVTPAPAPIVAAPDVDSEVPQLALVADAASDEQAFDQGETLSVDFACEGCDRVAGFRLSWPKNPPEEDVDGYILIFADGNDPDLATAIATVQNNPDSDDYLLFNVDDPVAQRLNDYGGGCAWVQAYKDDEVSDVSQPTCFRFPVEEMAAG